MMDSSESESSVMEISDDHTNQVYCRCSLCAEKGYGGAWVSRNTCSRHMKTERTHRHQYSKLFNSELTSDKYSTDSNEEIQIPMEDYECNSNSSVEIQIPIEDTALEDDQIIHDSDNSFENSSNGLLSSSSSMMSYYDEISNDSSSESDISQEGILLA